MSISPDVSSNSIFFIKSRINRRLSSIVGKRSSIVSISAKLLVFNVSMDKTLFSAWSIFCCNAFCFAVSDSMIDSYLEIKVGLLLFEILSIRLLILRSISFLFLFVMEIFSLISFWISVKTLSLSGDCKR